MPRMITPASPAELLPGGGRPAAADRTEPSWGKFPDLVLPVAPVVVETIAEPVAEPIAETASEISTPLAEPVEHFEPEPQPTTALSLPDARREVESRKGGSTSFAELTREHQLIEPIYEIAIRIGKLEADQARLKTQFEKVTAELDTAKSEQNILLVAMPAALIKIREAARIEAAKMPLGAPPKEPEPVIESEDWRDIPTPQALEGVHGLGHRRMVAITEKLPKVRDLIFARETAKRSDSHFATQLPKGTGKGLADSIATRLDRIEADRGMPVQPEDVKKSAHAREIKMIARSLAANATPEGLKDRAGENWVDGYEAKRSGHEVETCPEGLGSQNQADWVRGWLWAHLYGATGEPKADLPGDGDSVEAEPVEVGPAEAIQADEAAAEVEPEPPTEPNAPTEPEPQTPTLEAEPTIPGTDHPFPKIPRSAGLTTGMQKHLEKIAEEQCRSIMLNGENAAITESEDFVEGFHDQGDGIPLSDCPVEIEVHGKWESAGEQKIRLWVLGWCYGWMIEKGLKDENGIKVWIDEDLPQGRPSPVDFAKLAESIKASGQFDPKQDPPTAWNEGYSVALDGSELKKPAIIAGQSEPDLPTLEDYIRGFFSVSDLLTGL